MQFAEFETLSDRPGKRELLVGELIELPPAKQKHNQIAERIYLRLREILSEAGNPSLGEAHHEMGYLFEDGSWLQPDVSITHAGQAVEDYYFGSPALAVEIVSENNTADEIAGKVEVYLTNGASEVWVLYPNRGSSGCTPTTDTPTSIPSAWLPACWGAPCWTSPNCWPDQRASSASSAALSPASCPFRTASGTCAVWRR